MKFRKEYQTYLLIVIAIIIAGYFLKHFFFNKKKKIIEGQGGAKTYAKTYYRINFPTDFNPALNLTQQDLLKELILSQYTTAETNTDNTTGNRYVRPADEYDALLIPETPSKSKVLQSIIQMPEVLVLAESLLMKDSNGAIIGLNVVPLCDNRLEYFKQQAAAAAAADTGDATAAAAAYDYARLILSNKPAYKADANIMALIAAANLLTIIGQPTITNYNDTVVTTAKKAAFDAVDAVNDASNDTGNDASNAALNAMDAANAALNAMVDDEYTNAEADDAADAAAKAAGYANAYANNESLNDTTVTNNSNYTKVMTTYNDDPFNLKYAFIIAAGLIYQSISLKL